MSNQKHLTVTALTRYIKHKFETDQHLSSIWLRAEISNFKHHSRGHMYFTLKDDHARISAVMFAGYNQFLKFTPENGMDVIVKGSVSVFERQGQYQLYVHEMNAAGVGDLHVAFEQLKESLAKQGLFEQDKKKPIKAIPEHIGILTSRSGAAIQDILTTLKRRYPLAKLTIFPTLVQGEHAKENIVNNIEIANRDSSIDTLILARGGGSIEELWPFNEESVARSIFESKIPIITGVGHETDTTISDFVSDLRAPTPTAAAEVAVPSKLDLIKQVAQNRQSIEKAMYQRIDQSRQKLSRLSDSYAFNYPKNLIKQKEMDLDRLDEKLRSNMRQLLQLKKQNLSKTSDQLALHHPTPRIKAYQQSNAFLKQSMTNQFNRLYQLKKNQFSRQLDKLSVLSPLNTMKRGYSIAYNESGQIVKRIEDVEPGQSLAVKLSNGQVDCQVWGVEEETNE
ncbi:Exodeoxyribonuclease VII large subunit [Pelagirhabdus alkalitolerans]|uniref:Exodeoxyribonuclease 7 large subunit n=1 Tax=Pelagirhabdus alkalitolerans TaxID=1612202 RepID=A0A1G6I1T6_9BACI|nr:exodeoxyribonuclease VII large subunit [Pelagirhabdus alkalitolerans]SDC00444.1 Exodeoxyribonuclease VII large subunit [Pelagirhabdus alkalitolerans]